MRHHQKYASPALKKRLYARPRFFREVHQFVLDREQWDDRPAAMPEWQLCRVACESSTARPVLDFLLRTGTSEVLVALANNPRLPRDLFAALLKRSDANVLEVAITNPCLPYDLLQNIAEAHTSLEIRELAQSVLADYQEVE